MRGGLTEDISQLIRDPVIISPLLIIILLRVVCMYMLSFASTLKIQKLCRNSIISETRHLIIRVIAYGTSFKGK